MTTPTATTPGAPDRYLYHRHGPVSLYLGDAAQVLATLPEASVDCVVTSPPYWGGHRDYGTGTWTGGHPTCHHHQQPRGHRRDQTCTRCGATWHDPQYGLEETLEEYLDHLLGVFDQLARVLRPRGTCWLNLGDTYSTAGGGAPTGGKPDTSGSRTRRPPAQRLLAPKNLVGVPWRVALALQATGTWWLRQCVIWHKPNAMPESVRDRPSSSHEYLFLLTRSLHYFFDLDPIRIPLARPEAADGTIVFGGGRKAGRGVVGASARRRGNTYGPSAKYTTDPAAHHGRGGRGNLLATGTAHTSAHPVGRNPGSVWSISTRPSRLPHFAAFPIDLPLRCIAAGSPPGGVVLDPFAGVSTTGLAAVQLGRVYAGMDVSPAYHDLAKKRFGFQQLLAEPHDPHPQHGTEASQ